MPAVNRKSASSSLCSNAEGEMRCLCGSLIARLVDGGVEIKCRRCQRIVRLPLEGAPAAERSRP